MSGSCRASEPFRTSAALVRAVLLEEGVGDAIYVVGLVLGFCSVLPVASTFGYQNGSRKWGCLIPSAAAV